MNRDLETRPAQAPEQLRYARLLDWATRAGFAALVLSFLAYVLRLTPPLVPPEQLPALWSKPVAQYLAATATTSGWSWVTLLAHSDIAGLLGVVLLIGCSIPCLLALLPLYLRAKDHRYMALVLAEVAVLLLAASGMLVAGH